MAERIPLLLVPGLLCDEGLWWHQVEHLGDIAGSVRVVDLGSAQTIAAMADATLEQAPPGGISLAGLSMGGYVAFEVFRCAPERVVRLALLDTSPRPDTPRVAESRTTAIERARREPDFESALARLMRMLVLPAHLRDPDLMDRITQMVGRMGVASFVNHQRAIAGRPDSRPDLSRIEVPTLVLCGRQDRATPVALHEEMAAAVPGARLEVIEECGHLSALECPRRVTESLRRWLERGG